ncbi:MAG TPA: hypothetical protein VJV03_03450 [Pyrinomonadaceae bacterium]|nr:hypothetical protein [Pyrinomonadaceae bacterium]
MFDSVGGGSCRQDIAKCFGLLPALVVRKNQPGREYDLLEARSYITTGLGLNCLRPKSL